MTQFINFAEEFGDFNPSNQGIYNNSNFKSHYFGDITDKQLDDYLLSQGTGGLGNDVVFDAAGKLVEIDGVKVETGAYSQSGTTATIVQVGDQPIGVGETLNLIFNVGAFDEAREILTVASVISDTSFTVIRPNSQTVSSEVVSFYKENVGLSSTYTQTANVVTVNHNGTETLAVGDVVDLNVTSGSGTTQNATVTAVISSTQFQVVSNTAVTTSGNASFRKQNRQNLVEGSVDGINGFNLTLSSKQSNNLIDVLTEGEIAGFHTPLEANLTQGTDKYNIAALKDVFLNGTQVLKQSADINNLKEGDFNFARQDVSFEPRFGKSNQTSLTTINQIESETAVGVEVTKATPVSRTISNQIDKLRITIAFPSLQQFNTDDGSTDGIQVNLSIKITENNGTEHRAIDGSLGAVIGKTNTQYFRDYMIKGLSNLNYPITATVTRVTNDSTDTNLQNKFIWSSFSEITAEGRPYLDIAHVGLRFNAESFRSIPTRTYLIKGIKVKIPVNATVRADGSLSFSGSFNGTLKPDKEFTNDPAWVLYDVLTNTRYGASIPEANIDKFAFYSASEYNSEQIDDGSGAGTTEARFSCNVNINNQMDAFTLIQNICSVMRVQAFYEAGSITISQDRPSDPVYTFNISNVTEGGFSYTNQSQKAKFTKINVGFFDMVTQAIDYETVDDLPAQSRYGIKTQTIKAFGTTSRGQASRHAKWLLFNQNNSSELVNFSVTAEAGVLVRPGQIISVADELKQLVRRGGRIKTGISTTQIEVDDTTSTDLVSANSAKLSVILSDGTLETKEIAPDGISGATVTVSSAFSSVPQANSVWVIENTELEPTTWRVVNVQEQENLTFSITAASHNSAKYDFVEDGTPLPNKNFTVIIKKLPAPQNLTARQEIVVINNKAVSRLNIQFAAVKGAIGYYLQYNFNNGNFVTQQIKSTEFTIGNTKNGKYIIRVSSVNVRNQLSDVPNEITFNASGKTELPEDPTNLTVEPINDQFLRLRYTQSTSLDVLHGGTVEVRHSSDASQLSTFANSVQIIPAQSGNSTECIVPALSGTYSIKFVDDGGRRSKNAARVFATIPDAQPKQIILTRREDNDFPKFSGEKIRTIFSSQFDGLMLAGTTLFDFVDDVDALSSFDFSGPIASSGSYDFETKIDLGGKFNLNLKRHFVTSGILVNDLFDTRSDDVDDWIDFDGEVADNIDASLLVATTDSDPASSFSGTYSQSAKTITITKSSHGLSFGDFIEIDFTTGNASEILATYSQTAQTVTVTKSNHGFSFNDIVNINISSGAGINGTFTITNVPDSNTFQFLVSTFQSASGDCTINNINGEYEIVNVPTANTLVVTVETSTTTSGNCTFGAGFTQFNTFANGVYTARGFKFKSILTSNDLAQNISVTELGYTASMPRRIETVNTPIASGTSAKTVVFEHPFFAGTSTLGGSTSAFLPSIGITLEGAVSGDYFNITSVTGTQFVIEVKGDNDAFKNLNFKYTAIGFGKGI